MSNANITQKKRLFLDMDGVLAEYRLFESPEQYLQPGYYRSLKPHQNVIDGIRRFKKENPDVEIIVISAYYVMPGAVAPEEKRAWLEEHFPEIEPENIIFTPCGEPKENYIKGGIGKNDFLLDDYSFNLKNFMQSGGNAIKLLNGINNKRGSWQSNQLSYRKTPASFAKGLKDIIVNGKEVKHSIEEVQLRNEKEGLTLYLNKDELANIVNRYFDEFNNIEDFRANFTEEHWMTLKRIAMVEAPSTKIVPHVSLGQFEYEFNTFETKFQAALSSLSMGLKNKSEALFDAKDTIAKISAALETQKSNSVIILGSFLTQIKASLEICIEEYEPIQKNWDKAKKHDFEEIREMVNDFFDKHDNLDETEKKRLLAEKGVTVEDLKNKMLETVAQKELEFEIFDNVENQSLTGLCELVNNKYNAISKKIVNELKFEHTAPQTEKSCADDVLSDKVSPPTFTSDFDDLEKNMN